MAFWEESKWENTMSVVCVWDNGWTLGIEVNTLQCLLDPTKATIILKINCDTFLICIGDVICENMSHVTKGESAK